MNPRDHQAIRYRKRLPASAAPMGRRTNVRMARSLPTIGQELGNLHRFLNRMGPDRVQPQYRATNRKVLLRLINF